MPARSFVFVLCCLLPLAVPALHNEPLSDTTKYRGYRLELTHFQKIKEKDDWLKISFTVVNTGKMNVDLGRRGTEHWVVFHFDKSIFDAKLGGYRESIKRQLAQNGFKLDAGKSVTNMELKIPSVLPIPNKNNQTTDPAPVAPPADKSADKLAWETYQPTLPDSPRQGEPPPPPPPVKEQLPCPDIYFSDLKIIKQDDKYATLQYTLTNQGEGVYYLFGKNVNPSIQVFLSGVTTLTKGALPIGTHELSNEIRSNGELKRGESVMAQIRVDVRKKTRYMKSLILSIEGPQFASECNRTNNSIGLVLD